MRKILNIPMELRNNTKKVREYFQESIDEISFNGGGILYVPAGMYEVCMVKLKSNVHLELDKECVLHLPENENEYKCCRGEDIPFFLNEKHDAMFLVNECYNSSICGGKIVSCGKNFWDPRPEEEYNNTSCNTHIRYTPRQFRPIFITIHNSENIIFKDIILEDAAVYSVLAVRCSNLTFKRITILNDFYGPNTDGIHISSSINTKIEDCTFVTGDDSIAIDCDSGGTSDGLFINNCNFHTSVNVIRIYAGIEGGEYSRWDTIWGTVRNVSMSNCRITEASGIVNITAQKGYIENIEFYNIEANCTLEGTPVWIMTLIDGEVTNVRIKNFKCSMANGIATLVGKKDNLINNVKFEDYEIVCSPKNKIYDVGIDGDIDVYWKHHFAPCNLFLRWCDNIEFSNVKVNWIKNDEFSKPLNAKTIENCNNINFVCTDIPEYN